MGKSPFQTVWNETNLIATILIFFGGCVCLQVTIKALASSKDGAKQSSVVTKSFIVHETVEKSDTDEEETVSGGILSLVFKESIVPKSTM